MRKVNHHDAPFIMELVNNPSWIQYIGDRGVKNEGDALAYISNSLQKSYEVNNHGLLVMEKKEDCRPVGLCGLLQREYLDYPDLGFAIHPRFAKLGYTEEACRAVLDKAKTEFETIYAITTKENDTSRYLLQKLGFHLNQTIKTPDDNEFLLYVLTFDL